MLIIFAITLFAALTNLKIIFTFLGKILNLCLPLVLGLVIALILNAPMRGFEKIIDRCFIKSKRKPSLKTKYLISLLLSIISILIVLVIVFTMAVPEVIKSSASLISMIDKKIPDLLIFFDKYGIDTTQITDKLANFDSQQIVKNVIQGIVSIFSTALDATKIAVNFFSTAFFAFIIAVYLLIDKNNVSRQFKKMCYSVAPADKVNFMYKTAYLVRDTFTKFLTGQCLEALILAVLIFVLFTIFRLPYASLIAVMAAVLSFIPYVGSFVACFVGAFLTLIISPQKALISLIVYLGAQLIEQHFIYPHVVGNSVGLSPFYTVVAALLGGKLFGVLGMVFFIPLFSVILTLIRDFCNIEKKQVI